MQKKLFLTGLFFISLQAMEEYKPEAKLREETKKLEEQQEKLATEKSELEKKYEKLRADQRTKLEQYNNPKSYDFDTNQRRKLENEYAAITSQVVDLERDLQKNKLSYDEIGQQIKVKENQLRSLLEPQRKTALKWITDVISKIKVFFTSKMEYPLAWKDGEQDVFKNYNSVLEDVINYEKTHPSSIEDPNIRRERALKAPLGSQEYNPEYVNKLKQLSNARKKIIDSFNKSIQHFNTLLTTDVNDLTRSLQRADKTEKSKALSEWNKSRDELIAFLTKKSTPDELYQKISGERNPYTVLGLPKDATDLTIKTKADELSSKANRARLSTFETEHARNQLLTEREKVDSYLELLENINTEITSAFKNILDKAHNSLSTAI